MIMIVLLMQTAAVVNVFMITMLSLAASTWAVRCAMIVIPCVCRSVTLSQNSWVSLSAHSVCLDSVSCLPVSLFHWYKRNIPRSGK